MSDVIAECETAAYDAGLSAGLTRALSGVDPLAPPGTVAAVPAATVPKGAALISNRLTDREDISLVRCQRHEPSREIGAIAARLGAVRLGLLRRLIEHAVVHLSGRSADGERIIRKQLVAGALADAETAVEGLRRQLLAAGHHPVAVVDLHDRLTDLDWEIGKLFGASGILGDSPTRAVYAGELVANCWIAREDG